MLSYTADRTLLGVSRKRSYYRLKFLVSRCVVLSSREHDQTEKVMWCIYFNCFFFSYCFHIEKYEGKKNNKKPEKQITKINYFTNLFA